MNVHVVSLGCARNLVDAEIMLGRLKNAGARLIDAPQRAEVIVVNTCSFVESAADESIETILELARYKQRGRCRRLIVTGCLPERYREETLDALPEVDVFLGTGAFDRIVDAVMGIADPRACLLPDPDTIAPNDSGTARLRTPGPTAYLKIAEGCSRHCTYCIIPKLRGSQKSRSADAIVAEAGRLVQSGAKELVLVAQDTTAYGRDLAKSAGLGGLLQSLVRLPGDFRIRFLYGHPESIDAEVIRTVAEQDRICSYFDIPIQHVSRSVLQRMCRRYAVDDLRRLFDRIRAAAPDAALRTTVIVGFPGESDNDFLQLMQFVEEIGFDHLGAFTYSDAEDLASHRLDAHVPPAVARKRYHTLMVRQQELSLQRNRRYLGTVCPVLIEAALESGLYSGRTEFQAPEVDGMTYVHADHLSIGAMVDVKIIDTLEYDLVGERR
ncbi:MAG TPA: 30S ribosomal protein S12 methylthiotransferase RimO [Desulfobacterales bacterium]